MAIGVISGYAGLVNDIRAAYDEEAAGSGQAISGERKAFYGIAEIAEALGLNRQLVTAWRRRRSHGMPEPDAELSSGPIWLGSSVEAWIDQVRERREGADDQPLSPEVAFRASRRMLRIAALLLDQPIRPRLLSQALAEARELLPLVESAADDQLGRAVGQLLSPVRGTDDQPVDLKVFRQKVLSEVARLQLVVQLASESLPDSESGG
jgi:transposase-like protein